MFVGQIEGFFAVNADVEVATEKSALPDAGSDGRIGNESVDTELDWISGDGVLTVLRGSADMCVPVKASNGKFATICL